MPLRCLSALCAAVFALLAQAPAAHAAEDVLLVSGDTLRVATVEVDTEAKQLRLTLETATGLAQVIEPYSRIAPRALLRLLRTHHVAPQAGDLARAQALLHLAQVAEARERDEVAGEAFVEAAALDPALAARRDAGLARLRSRGAARVLDEVEGHVRARHAHRALAAVEAARAANTLEAWTPVERMRLRVLERMARRLVPGGALPQVPGGPLAGDEPQAPPAPAPAPVAPVAPAPAAGVLPAALEKVRLAVRSDLRIARAARLDAADPALPASRVQRALDKAAKAYLAARRRLLALAGPLTGPLLTQAAEAHNGLLDVTLASAESLRLRRRRTEALRYLGAARALDPESPAVLELAARLEGDRRSRLDDPYPYGGYLFDGVSLGGFTYGTLYGTPSRILRTRRGSYYGTFPGRSLGIRGLGPYRGGQRLRGGGGGSRRVVGRRR